MEKREILGRLEIQDSEATLACKELLEDRGLLGHQESKEILVYQVLREIEDQWDHPVHKVLQEIKVCQDQKDL
jgi:hypothetical protein